MNGQIAAYEKRLRTGARTLERMESTGSSDGRYERALRSWLALLAAYEYETEVAEAGSQIALAAGV